MNKAMAGRKLKVDIKLIKCDKYFEHVMECKEVMI